MRWLVRVIGAIVALVVVALIVVVMVPTERIAELAAAQIEAATGRSVRIEGDVRPTVWPALGVRAETFEIGNPSWVDQGPMIAADVLSVRVPWSGIFSGQFQIEEITLSGAQVVLVRAADGRASWDVSARDTNSTGSDPAPSAEATAPASGAGAGGFALARAELRDARVIYLDIAADQRFDVDDMSADIALPATGLAAISAQASVNGTALDVEAGIDGVDALLEGTVRPVTLSVEWSGGSVAFDGRASLDPALDGTLTASATDLAPVFAALGQAAPDLPQGVGRDEISVAGAITLTEDGSLYLRDTEIGLDQNRLTVALDVLQGAERPLIRGTVQSAGLDLSGLAGGDAAAGGTAGGSDASAQAGATGWSTDPIDVSGLFAADLEIGLALGGLNLGPASLGAVEGQLTNSAGRAVLDIRRATVYGGTLAGQVIVNGRGGLSSRVDVLLADVQLSPLLGALAGYERLEGSGSISLNVLGVGNDMATLMASLDGQGDLAFGAGAILGLDIAGMIRNFDTSFQGEGARTVYDSIVANFSIDQGVLQNDDLRLDAPWGAVTGAGLVNIGAQTLDYRVVPGVMRDDQGGTQIAVPILISGPWSSPSIRPDLAYLAEQELAAEAERLEAEAQARIAAEADRLEEEARQRANEALGTDLQAGDTLEDAGDALEQRLREQAEEQLRNLLGGN